MKVNPEGIQASTSEIQQWMVWFHNGLTKRMSREDADNVFSLVRQFMQSAETFAELQSGSKECHVCNGKGHSNLYRVGQSKPDWCDNCKGMGMVPHYTKEVLN